MNMTPTELAAQEARKIVEKLFSSLEPNEEAIDLITSVLLPKYELATDMDHWISRLLQNLEYRTTTNVLGKKDNGFAFAPVPEWELRQKQEAISSTLQKIGGGR